MSGARAQTAEIGVADHDRTQVRHRAKGAVVGQAFAIKIKGRATGCRAIGNDGKPLIIKRFLGLGLGIGLGHLATAQCNDCGGAGQTLANRGGYFVDNRGGPRVMLPNGRQSPPFRESGLPDPLAGAGALRSSADMNASPKSPLIGIFWMVMTGLNFVAVTAIVKHVGDAIPPAQAAFLRYALGVVFLIPMIRPILAAHLTRRQVKLFALRGVVHTLAVILWFFAMTQIPIAEVTAMNYLSPIYVTIGAALFLGEALPPRRLAAVVMALIGALIILRPGLREVEMGHFAMLFTALGFAAGYLIAKQLSGEVSAPVVVGMLSVTVTIGLFPFALMDWVTPTLADIGWLFLVACFATAGHYCMTLAFAAAPLTVTQPVTFLQLVWAVMLGALVFGETVDGWVICGGAVIMASISFITWREARARRQITPSVPATKG